MVFYQRMIIACRTQQEALDLLRHCLEEGKVIYGRHFREELANEGLSIEDAWSVLRHGQIFRPPEQDIKTREWKYRIEGREPAGTTLAVVFCFKEIDSVFLMTIFSIECKGRGIR